MAAAGGSQQGASRWESGSRVAAWRGLRWRARGCPWPWGLRQLACGWTSGPSPGPAPPAPGGGPQASAVGRGELSPRGPSSGREGWGAVGAPGPDQAQLQPEGAEPRAQRWPRGWYLELGGPRRGLGRLGLSWVLRRVLQGIELLLSQELGPRIHGELARMLHVGGGAPAPIHGGPQRGLVHDVSCGQGGGSCQPQGWALGCVPCLLNGLSTPRPSPPTASPPLPPPRHPRGGCSLPQTCSPHPTCQQPGPGCPYRARGGHCGVWDPRAGGPAGRGCPGGGGRLRAWSRALRWGSQGAGSGAGLGAPGLGRQGAAVRLPRQNMA